MEKTGMSKELILKNAKIVTPSGTVEGSLHLREGKIAGIDTGAMESAKAIDFAGDYLIPGLIDLHTDNAERHIRPRRDAEWLVLAALLAHDGEVCSAGITTVFDSLYVGGLAPGGPRSSGSLLAAIAALETGRDKNLFRAEHFLHTRCETTREQMPDLFATVYPNPLVKLVSVMDHTPGQRQFANLERGAGMGGGRFGGGGGGRARQGVDEPVQEPGMTPEERQEKIAAPNRAKLIAMLAGHPVALASHDDATVEHVEQSYAEGISISEFPTTVAAAQAARDKGMKIIAGSPNVVIGRSLTGNVAVEELARLGLLDALASDYVPSSLLYAAFLLHRNVGLPLHETVKMVTLHPAELTGLDDRGSIEIGKRADLVRVRMEEGLPVPTTVWREGKRVC
jgi:alpha-D-ribose 1-methylphosphonate 5-triphosphate diphosphatase